MRGERGAGRRAELSPDLTAVDGHAAQQQRGRRSGDGKDPVRRVHGPAADVDRRADDSVRTEFLHQHADAEHIGQRVQRAKLVQVDVFHICSVHFTLRLRNAPVNSLCVLLCLLRSVCLFQQSQDLTDGGMRMMSGALLCAFFLTVSRNVHMGAADAVFPVVIGGHGDIVGERGIQPAQKALPVGVQLQQRCHQHIAGSAHRTIQIQKFHDVPP